MGDYEWPDDINEWDAWPEQTGLDWIDEFLARIEGFTVEAFKEVLLEEILPRYDATIIAERAAELDEVFGEFPEAFVEGASELGNLAGVFGDRLLPLTIMLTSAAMP